MSRPDNLISFSCGQPTPEEEPNPASNVLGMLHRKDFELWVCRAPDGTLTLKWWRWREDLERFFPLEDGELTLDPSELQPLADLLSSVTRRLKLKATPGQPGFR